jgi:predicted lipoprotein
MAVKIMKKLLLIAFLATPLLMQSGCKIVKDLPEGEAEIPADQSGDDARNAIRLDETFESQLVPHINDNALVFVEFQQLLNTGLDAAGEARGYRGAGQGAAWNFPVRGEGTIVEAKLDTRARVIGVDTNADGTADVTIQLGPVIKGTALRDVGPFYKFDDFRDQIEFAKFSRTVNNKIKDTLVVPEGEIIGNAVSFVGVIPLKSATGKIVLTPIEIEFTK